MLIGHIIITYYLFSHSRHVSAPVSASIYDSQSTPPPVHKTLNRAMQGPFQFA
jgi:hypothetical protein